ncbi:putative transposase, fragment [Hymenobacter roseosalivarius DSM 11622]|uniref:Putative transposase n=1 Tax=Hymenobacter roseosalivarius DSM 11622 TaxID=645990 RepID=A0A1W1VZN1_9BACT|nr:IS630 family transposase [Hymenobacter roseosalivarius]SMB98817.1 putative transposase, fragment [Hymenobacter roseosalivarius DSM 11622]
MQQLRRQHVEAIAGRGDVHRFYFLDETGLRLDYCRRYARAPGGRRVGGAVPLTRGRSLTLIGALGVRGLTAVQVLAGALNQRRFAFYVGRVLGPQLRRGDVLVLDNLAVHKLGGLREGLAARGVEVLFLPPYSPDFTPVEQAWSKLKTNLRQAQARTGQALEAAIQTAVEWITGDDAKAWFNHCGYHVHRS